VHHAALAGSVPAVVLMMKRTPGAAALAKLLKKADKEGLYNLRIQLTHSLKAPGFIQPLVEPMK
jgi:hypothetical protein